MRWLTVCLVMVGMSAAADETVSRLAPLVRGVDGVRIAEEDVNGGTIELDDHSGDLRLSTVAPPGGLPRVATRSFYVSMFGHRPDPHVVERLVPLAHLIEARDDGALGFTRLPPQVPRELPAQGLWIFAFAMWLFVPLVVWWRRAEVVWDFKTPHVIVGVNQALILGYLWLYWTGVGDQVASILAQIALAYAVDALVMSLRFRRWAIGVGPVPIVLSCSLFAWFSEFGSAAMIIVAISSRALIRRGGRHILNPSATGLLFASVLSYPFDQLFRIDGIFSRLTAPPNMVEVLLILPLLPQLRFRIVLASIGAIFGLFIGGAIFGNVPGIAMPGTLILMAIFLTDPATQPKSPVGQLCFGLFVGIGAGVTTWAGYRLGSSDDRLSKILPVVVGNALVPFFEGIGRRAERLRLFVLAPRFNVAHVVVYLSLIVPLVIANKPSQFNGPMHWTYGTPLVVRSADDVPRCEENPIFCRFFTFGAEARAWLARATAPDAAASRR